MTIAAKYEDGVFNPLEDVKLTEGARVEVHVREAAERPPFQSSSANWQRSGCGLTTLISPME
jgi:predicted DNA-binding antitoxin AbrB/MazE fold protein